MPRGFSQVGVRGYTPILSTAGKIKNCLLWNQQDCKTVGSLYENAESLMTAKLDQLVQQIERQNITYTGWATPGSTLHSAALELARMVCRRDERRVCALQKSNNCKIVKSSINRCIPRVVGNGARARRFTPRQADALERISGPSRLVLKRRERPALPGAPSTCGCTGWSRGAVNSCCRNSNLCVSFRLF
ncbi:MAG: ATP:cob(I)alamin adenosyltransferase [Verrucomicrobiales bacterium]|nr:ATP:cob(I)alamin adenosyltransferase [Verrucomicrobiales bacterium]